MHLVPVDRTVGWIPKHNDAQRQFPVSKFSLFKTPPLLPFPSLSLYCILRAFFVTGNCDKWNASNDTGPTFGLVCILMQRNNDVALCHCSQNVWKNFLTVCGSKGMFGFCESGSFEILIVEISRWTKWNIRLFLMCEVFFKDIMFSMLSLNLWWIKLKACKDKWYFFDMRTEDYFQNTKIGVILLMKKNE